MDFLSKLGEKAGEAIQTVKESEITHKAKNYAGIPALSIQVGKLETSIKQTYEMIGREYFQNHKDDENSEFAKQFESIKEAMAKIAELKEEIEAKKGNGSEDIVTEVYDETSVEVIDTTTVQQKKNKTTKQ